MTKIVKLSALKEEQLPLMDVLHKLMQRTNININQLSKNTGLANTTIKRMLTEHDSNPTLASITKLAEFFGITPNQLIGNEPLPEGNVGYYPAFEQWSKVPLLNISQAAAWPNILEEVKEQPDTEYVLTDIETNEKVFAVIASDETLEPKFSEGTILIFDPTRNPKNKDYVMLVIEDNDIPQFRQILIDGPDMYAKTVNPEFSHGSPLKLTKGNFKILGVLIQAKSNYA